MIKPLVLLAAIAVPLSYAGDLSNPFTLTLLQKDSKNDLKFTNFDEKAQTFSFKQTDSDDIQASEVENPKGLKPPELTSDTGLERPLNVIFQISDYENVDWTFRKFPDRSMDLTMIEYEEAISNHSETAFIIAEKKLGDPGSLNDEEKAFDKWTGGVGRMAILRAAEGTRDFTWSPVRPKKGESSPRSRYCHVKVKSDPHAETVYVNLDKVSEEENQPQVTLNPNDAGAGEWPDKADKGGDAGVVEVKCDDILGNIVSEASGITFAPTPTKGPSKRIAKPE